MLVIASSHLNPDSDFISDFDNKYNDVYKTLCKYYNEQIEFNFITTINEETTKNLSIVLPIHTRNLIQIIGTFPSNEKLKNKKYDIIWITSGPNYTILKQIDEYCTSDAICFYTRDCSCSNSNIVLQIIKNPFHKKIIFSKHSKSEYNELMQYVTNDVHLISDPLFEQIIQIGYPPLKDYYLLTEEEKEYIYESHGNEFILQDNSVNNIFEISLSFMREFKQNNTCYIYRRKSKK